MFWVKVYLRGLFHLSCIYFNAIVMCQRGLCGTNAEFIPLMISFTNDQVEFCYLYSITNNSDVNTGVKMEGFVTSCLHSVLSFITVNQEELE